jgi:hypothetical protein
MHTLRGATAHLDYYTYCLCHNKTARTHRWRSDGYQGDAARTDTIVIRFTELAADETRMTRVAFRSAGVNRFDTGSSRRTQSNRTFPSER